MQEGMRRMGVALASVGILIGAFAAYSLLVHVGQQRAKHSAFEKLVSLQATKDRILNCHSTVGDSDLEQTAQIPEANNELRKEAIRRLDEEAAKDAEIERELERAGIQIIHIDKTQTRLCGPLALAHVDWIERKDGTRVYNVPSPGPGSYLLPLSLPILGWFIPWLAIRTIAWVIGGFIG